MFPARYCWPLGVGLILLLLISWINFPPLATSPSSPLPFPQSNSLPPPSITAQFVFIKDIDSGLVLYQKHAAELTPPASTTKILTALVAVDQFPLDTRLTVPKSFPEGSHLGFIPGETLTAQDLLYALLIPSANDAAEILAANHSQGRPGFIAAMNSKAQGLNLTSSHFLNPTGLDQPGHVSTAADLARLATALEASPVLSRIVSSQNAVISTSARPFYLLNNTNLLLGKVEGVIGLKTGFTDGAGQSVITYLNRGGHPVVIALLGSTNRFADTQSLITWIYKNFTWSNSSAIAP